jgi:uncharacterized protein (DUF885 family)
MTPRSFRPAPLLAAVLAACATLALPPLAQAASKAAASAPASHDALAAASARFHALLDTEWNWQMETNPEWATSIGDHRFDDRLSDNSPAGVARVEAHDRDWLAALQRVDRTQLRGEDLISLDDALLEAKLDVERQKYPALRTRRISAMGGAHLHLPSVMEDMPIRSEADARHALARLAAMPLYVQNDIGWLREGKRLGWVTFRASLSHVPEQIDGLLARPIDQSPLFSPFARLPADLPAERAEALRSEARALLKDRVLPAFGELERVVVDELLPASPESGAMSGYPDGAAIYRLAIRQQTTLDWDAQRIHDIGLAEVARIRGEMEATMREAKFTGSFPEFVKFLNTDPRFFYQDGKDLLAGYRDIAKRVDPELPKLFVQLPRTPYGVRAIPEYQGDGTPEFYSQGAADGSAPGWFNANVVAVAHRPRWEMEALFLHEAVPGHHLQISRALELGDLPMFRRTAEINSYVEGWALYAESLGPQVGMYKDPYSRFGRLRMEIWRAARLVVDTGIHALGWSRQQAIDWMEERTGISHADVVAEVDRYYVWPAQALGYKLGELEIKALRDRARERLGDRFDLRRFHQAILDHGALPLPVLSQQIDTWIGEEQRRTAGGAAPAGTGPAAR